MALIACGECENQISDKAATCPHCGAPAQTTTTNLPPVDSPASGSKLRLWLWIPAGLVAAFFLFGALQPEYKTRAIEMRKACEVMIGANLSRQRECDKIYSDAIAKGRAEAAR